MLRLDRGAEHEPVDIDPGEAAEWLRGNDTGDEAVNRRTVRLYDFADADADDATGPGRASPRDHVSFADLGRMTCFAAQLTYERAHLLMQLSRVVSWPQDLPRLDDCPQPDDTDPDAFITHPGVERAHQLFRAFKDHSGLGSGTVSKLLHLKWPALFPVADSAFRRVYSRRAAQIHTASSELEGRRSDDGNIRAYWLALRTDLARNRDPLADLPAQVQALADGDVDALAHARRLAQLEPLRLLDMLAWNAGR